MYNFTPIINAVIALCAAAVTYWLIPWIKAHTTAEQQAGIRATVRVFIMAAEQIYGAGHGPEKMEYVKQQLEARGISISIAEIEAAVYEEFNFLRDKPGGGIQE